MRTDSPVLLLAAFVVLPLAGCLDDAAETQSVADETAWFVAQADAATGDVAGFVWTLPDRLCLGETSVSAEASPEGASASAAGASAQAGPDGASASAACATVTAGMDGASVDASGASASLTYDGLALEVVPDFSALQTLHQAAVLVFKVEGGVATQVGTSLATQVETLTTDVDGQVESALHEAQAVAFSLPLDGLELQPGDQLAFIVAAQATATTTVDGAVQTAVDGAVSATAALPAGAVDFGIAFRFVDAATSNIEAAVAELQSIASSHAGAHADAAFSLLDSVAASGQAEVLATVGMAQGFDVGFFGELTAGMGAQAQNIKFLTDSLSYTAVRESAARALAATEQISLGYEGIAVDGWGFGLGAYGGAENGQVDYEVQANVHDQSFSTAGSITAAGPFDLGDADPAYVLSGAGGQAQSLAFDLTRTAQEQAVALFALHFDLSADLQAMLGVDAVVPATAESLVSGIPVRQAADGLTFEAGALGSVRLAVTA